MPSFLSNGATIIIAVLLVLAIAYRYYSAFIAAKVLALDPARTTPAHTLNDGQNYHPTNKWVLFGHHFAAISGAGPLIGPVLAAQFGYLPGLLWILIGVCLGGAVQDFVILAFSMRRNGKSLAQIAFSEIGPVAGAAATIGILFVLVIALAGLGKVVTKALGGETVTYAAGTAFREAPLAQERIASITIKDNSSPMWTRYQIGTGVIIEFANGAKQTVTSPFVLVMKMDKDNTRDPRLFAAEQGFQVLRVPEGGKAEHVIAGSSWGTFTIAMTIPIALAIGVYLYRIRKGRVLEASIIGGVLTLGAVYVGGMVADPYSPLNAMFAETFNLTGDQVGYAMAIYGFVASILPVWILLCPRDYLSSFLKIGTVALLIIGVILARPHLHAPAFNTEFLGGGPVIGAGKAVIPFVFITIMCGAISGFHALVSSGTTPKMISNEKDARMIGYGSMLIEGLVGIVALIAACALPVDSYYRINTPAKDLPNYQAQIESVAKNDRMAGIDNALPDVGEHLEGRTGGAVTLAVGMAKVFNDAITNVSGADPKAPWLGTLFKYWYHFAIMFEALFILTTIDTGTRVGRFLVQETLGKWVHPKFAQTDWWVSSVLATALVTGGWWYFLNFNAFAAIWNMFGVANQMLAVIAMAVATAVLAKNGKKKYIPVTLIPMCVVAITTTWAAILLLSGYITALRKPAATHLELVNAGISAGCLIAILVCAAIVIVGMLARIGLKPLPAHATVKSEG